jgi:hypothetical protein
MTRLLKIISAAIVVCNCLLPCSAQCGFSIQPASEIRWYRDAGWQTPGVTDAKAIGKLNVTINGKPQTWPDGITVSMITHEDNYRVHFPEMIFEDNGIHKRMLSRVFKLQQLLRWEMNGKPYAYSYDLWPYDVACSSTVDIIDDKGDGKFRLMTSPGHTIVSLNPVPPPVPEWLKKPQL